MPDESARTEISLPPHIVHDPSGKPYLVVALAREAVCLISLRPGVEAIEGSDELATEVRLTQGNTYELIRSPQQAYVTKWGNTLPPPSEEPTGEVKLKLGDSEGVGEGGATP